MDDEKRYVATYVGENSIRVIDPYDGQEKEYRARRKPGSEDEFEIFADDEWHELNVNVTPDHNPARNLLYNAGFGFASGPTLAIARDVLVPGRPDKTEIAHMWEIMEAGTIYQDERRWYRAWLIFGVFRDRILEGIADVEGGSRVWLTDTLDLMAVEVLLFLFGDKKYPISKDISPTPEQAKFLKELAGMLRDSTFLPITPPSMFGCGKSFPPLMTGFKSKAKKLEKRLNRKAEKLLKKRRKQVAKTLRAEGLEKSVVKAMLDYGADVTTRENWEKIVDAAFKAQRKGTLTRAQMEEKLKSVTNREAFAKPYPWEKTK